MKIILSKSLGFSFDPTPNSKLKTQNYIEFSIFKRIFKQIYVKYGNLKQQLKNTKLQLCRMCDLHENCKNMKIHLQCSLLTSILNAPKSNTTDYWIQTNWLLYRKICFAKMSRITICLCWLWALSLLKNKNKLVNFIINS